MAKLTAVIEVSSEIPTAKANVQEDDP